MGLTKRIKTEIWAKLILSREDRTRIHDFLVSEFGIDPRCVVRNMHITVYHARRPIPELFEIREPVRVVLPASETRFMVMAPGGENPRPELNPCERKVGIRVHKKSTALPLILQFRNRLLEYETEKILGGRSPSTNAKNAFGARHFQPHMTMIRPGSGIDRDLTIIGAPFREALGDLSFNNFVINIVKNAQ